MQSGSTSVKSNKYYSSPLRSNAQKSSYSSPLFEGVKELCSLLDCVQYSDRYIRHDMTTNGDNVYGLLGVVHIGEEDHEYNRQKY